MDQDHEMFDLYLHDMKEHLELLNEHILLLDNNPGGKEIINTLFRVFHTIKGSSATMGYTKLAETVHRMEDLLQDMRDGRVIADLNTVQLLFACHDFIERVIEQISSTGSGEDIECSYIIAQLDSYEKKQAAASEEPAVSVQEIRVSCDELTVNPSELEYIKKKATLDYVPYIVGLTLAPDCLFKTIRAWMAFEQLERIAEIVKSSPIKPRKQEFDSGMFVFESSDIKALVISTKTGAEIWNHLHQSLMEIEQIRVDEYAVNQERDVNIIDSIIEGKADGNLPGLQFPASIVKEIKNQVSLSEIACLDVLSDLEDRNLINSIWHPFHIIKELSAHINHTMIYNIAAGTEKFLDVFLTKKDNLDGNHLNTVIESLASVKALCDDASLLSSKEYLKDIDRHLGSMFRYADGMTEKTASPGLNPKPNKLKLGEILMQEGVVDQQGLDYLVDKQRQSYPGLKFGQVVLKEKKASLKKIVDALSIQSGAAKVDQKSQPLIRISEQKVDCLVDMLGELLIIQSLHKQEVSDLQVESGLDSRLNNILRMERITKDIQTVAMSLRMVSLRQTFHKLLRIGRDTANELHKDVTIILSGEDTEIDRSVVEKIQDPLMHIVRNAISHGIEAQKGRLARNKPAQGQVRINAYNKRGFVYIEVIDDGQGLQIENLYQAAREKGLIDPHRSYCDDEVLRFIYIPGFSTHENIDSISGRGVGMNVAETGIQGIGGKIEIANRPGNGCAFILKIPINLATINGTIVDVFGGRYILPTLNIKQVLKPDAPQWVMIKGKPDMIRIRKEIIPMIPINNILGLNDNTADFRDALIIVLELENTLKALPVKSVLGKQEIVVKPLGTEFRNLDFISGATILGDGRVSLILDIETLFKFNTGATAINS
jgi:two-component system chemotaxis sensor kinase CheA